MKKIRQLKLEIISLENDYNKIDTTIIEKYENLKCHLDKKINDLSLFSISNDYDIFYKENKFFNHEYIKLKTNISQLKKMEKIYLINTDKECIDLNLKMIEIELDYKKDFENKNKSYNQIKWKKQELLNKLKIYSFTLLDEDYENNKSDSDTDHENYSCI